ncbi:hypothetical protein F4804DRAFT_183174 [Jackrogersella minutella]|nr:hypothetical protein F4804DRAFT_183174 [Jackrogersella minutella]
MSRNLDGDGGEISISQTQTSDSKHQTKAIEQIQTPNFTYTATANMFTNTISLISLAAAVFSTQALARSCHLETTVYHDQTSACGAGSCIPGDSFSGTGVLQIDGNRAWNGDGANYDTLTKGNGIDVDVDGVKFHIDPLGKPDIADGPTCKIHLGSYTNLGKPSTDGTGLPGIVGTKFDCVHDFLC